MRATASECLIKRRDKESPPRLAGTSCRLMGHSGLGGLNKSLNVEGSQSSEIEDKLIILLQRYHTARE